MSIANCKMKPAQLTLEKRIWELEQRVDILESLLAERYPSSSATPPATKIAKKSVPLSPPFVEPKQKEQVVLTSISCPTSKANANCSILVLRRYISTHGPKVRYGDILQYFQGLYAKFGGFDEEFSKFDEDRQIPMDLFESALQHFLPNHEVQLYQLIQKPNQVREAFLKRVNFARRKVPQHLALIASWDRKSNSVGAGHYVILDAPPSMNPEQILDALRGGNFRQEQSMSD
jgi:hypothetical protein